MEIPDKVRDSELNRPLWLQGRLCRGSYLPEGFGSPPHYPFPYLSVCTVPWLADVLDLYNMGVVFQLRGASGKNQDTRWWRKNPCILVLQQYLWTLISRCTCMVNLTCDCCRRRGSFKTRSVYACPNRPDSRGHPHVWPYVRQLHVHDPTFPKHHYSSIELHHPHSTPIQQTVY